MLGAQTSNNPVLLSPPHPPESSWLITELPIAPRPGLGKKKVSSWPKPQTTLPSSVLLSSPALTRVIVTDHCAANGPQARVREEEGVLLAGVEEVAGITQDEVLQLPALPV